MREIQLSLFGLALMKNISLYFFESVLSSFSLFFARKVLCYFKVLFRQAIVRWLGALVTDA